MHHRGGPGMCRTRCRTGDRLFDPAGRLRLECVPILRGRRCVGGTLQEQGDRKVIFEAGLYDHDHGHHQGREGNVAVELGILYLGDSKLVVV
jgi:hypothetical protein